MTFHRQDSIKTVVVQTQAEALKYMQELDDISSDAHKSTTNTAKPKKKKKKGR